MSRWAEIVVTRSRWVLAIVLLVVLFAGGMFVFLIVALLLPVYDLVQQAITSPQF